MRILQYAERYECGHLKPDAVPSLQRDPMGHCGVDGGGGIGIPVACFAARYCCAQTSEQGIMVLPVRNLGHNGRLGVFADDVRPRVYLIRV
jgi:LDH2 family malate/lactate/ureidoglycolate dehydrogenase